MVSGHIKLFVNDLDSLLAVLFHLKNIVVIVTSPTSLDDICAQARRVQTMIIEHIGLLNSIASQLRTVTTSTETSGLSRPPSCSAAPSSSSASGSSRSSTSASGPSRRRAVRHRPIHFDISGGVNDADDVSTNSQSQPKDETTHEFPFQRFAVDVMTDLFFSSDADDQTMNHQPQLKAEMARQPLIQNIAEYVTEIEKDCRALQNYKKAAKADEKQDEKDNKVVKSGEIAEPRVEPIDEEMIETLQQIFAAVQCLPQLQREFEENVDLLNSALANG